MLLNYGKAPFFILVVAVATGIGVLVTHRRYEDARPDLVLMTHAKLHADVYLAKLPEFERKYGVKVDVQVVEQVALRTRLLAAFAAGTPVPDLVEIPQDAALFLRGPIRDIGFLDITKWVRARNLEEKMVSTRFTMWQRKGVIFALPHDVHPMMLAYRADIVEDQLGIDVSKIATWDDFAAMARRIVRYGDDGRPARYALEFQNDGGYLLQALLLQRDVGLFDAAGNVTFDSDVAADTVAWAVRQLRGPHRIAYSLGFGPTLWEGMQDGLVLFYFAPDWRTKTIEEYAPSLAGKMKLMPLPAWTPGGRRTSTWGATGLAATKGGRNPELAKKLMEFLYVDQTDGGKSSADLHILSPVRSAWSLPLFDKPDPYFRGQPIMRLYSLLAGDVPADYANPFITKAQNKRDSAFVAATAYYSRHGEDGFPEFVRAELKRQADAVRAVIARNQITEQ
jgi:arabinosaccharide transport system substrate-binding protein